MKPLVLLANLKSQRREKNLPLPGLDVDRRNWLCALKLQ
jgi:hypothetical protein